MTGYGEERNEYDTLLCIPVSNSKCYRVIYIYAVTDKQSSCHNFS